MMKKTTLIWSFLLSFTFSSTAQWEWVNPRPSGYLASTIIFTDTLSGFILSGNGDLVNTTDQGGNWSVKKNFPNGVILDLKDSTGIIAGNGGTIYVSRDNGNNWLQKNSGTFDNFFAADIVSRDTIFVAARSGKIYRTDNGGDTWLPFYCGIQISSIEFINSKVGLQQSSR